MEIKNFNYKNVNTEKYPETFFSENIFNSIHYKNDT